MNAKKLCNKLGEKVLINHIEEISDQCYRQCRLIWGYCAKEEVLAIFTYCCLTNDMSVDEDTYKAIIRASRRPEVNAANGCLGCYDDSYLYPREYQGFESIRTSIRQHLRKHNVGQID